MAPTLRQRPPACRSPQMAPSTPSAASSSSLSPSSRAIDPVVVLAEPRDGSGAHRHAVHPEWRAGPAQRPDAGILALHPAVDGLQVRVGQQIGGFVDGARRGWPGVGPRRGTPAWCSGPRARSTQPSMSSANGIRAVDEPRNVSMVASSIPSSSRIQTARASHWPGMNGSSSTRPSWVGNRPWAGGPAPAHPSLYGRAFEGKERAALHRHAQHGLLQGDVDHLPVTEPASSPQGQDRPGHGVEAPRLRRPDLPRARPAGGRVADARQGPARRPGHQIEPSPPPARSAGAERRERRQDEPLVDGPQGVVVKTSRGAGSRRRR